MSAVAEFELLFHEILQIMNVEDQILGNKTMVHLETHIQHSLHAGAVLGSARPCAIRHLRGPIADVLRNQIFVCGDSARVV